MKKALLLGLSLWTLGSVTSVASAQGVTIRINGYGGTDPAVVGDLINRFVRPALARDNINVVYEPLQGDYNVQLTNRLSANTAGDVFYLPGETVQPFVATGRILPLNGLIDASPFLASLNRTFTVNNRLYAIAKDFNTLALVYNRDIFEEARVPVPDANDTWTTFADKLRRVRAALGNNINGICFPASYDRFGAFAFSAGWRPFNENNRTLVNTASFRRAFDFYTGLVRARTAVQPSDLSQGWGGGCFATGRVAAAIEGNWIVNFLRDEAPNLRYGTAPLPKDPTTNRRGNFLYTVGWAINANTPNRAAAVRVVQALTSVQAQTYILEQGLALPSRRALQNNAFLSRNTPASQNANIVFRGASDGNVQTFTAGRLVLNDFQRPINEALTAAMTAQTAAAAALQRAQTALNTLQGR